MSYIVEKHCDCDHEWVGPLKQKQKYIKAEERERECVYTSAKLRAGQYRCGNSSNGQAGIVLDFGEGIGECVGIASFSTNHHACFQPMP